ncbi:hypothetical protein [Paenibacillus flagellatus]|uniref:Uncharacterized protein n=1 Tax=Paenibacillus flagellatus TaxID=2211139 RepID=A0A2V5KIX5_9BACL|nr:hypothetical protein [Paenibacillus flagellatus]PYI54510.1 hypothetical protein DLM86_13675 [Paenibacillus flagellatus]
MVNTIDMRLVRDKLNVISEQFAETLFLLKAKQNADGVSLVTRKEMAAAMRITPKSAVERIDGLIRFGLVEKLDDKSYKIVHTEVERTALGMVTGLIRVVSEQPDASYKRQAEALGITVKELEYVYETLVDLIR